MYVCMYVYMYVHTSRNLDKLVIIFVMRMSIILLHSATKQHTLYEQRLKQGSNQSSRLWSCGFWNKGKRHIAILQTVATERVSLVNNKIAHFQRPLSY